MVLGLQIGVKIWGEINQRGVKGIKTVLTLNLSEQLADFSQLPTENQDIQRVPHSQR